MKDITKKISLLLAVLLTVITAGAHDTLPKRKIYLGVVFSSAYYKAYNPPESSAASPQSEIFPYRFGLDAKSVWVNGCILAPAFWWM